MLLKWSGDLDWELSSENVKADVHAKDTVVCHALVIVSKRITNSRADATE